MRFSSIAVIAAMAPVASGFAPFQRQFSSPQTGLRAVEYDLDLGFDEAPKKGAKKVAPAPVPVPEPVPAPKATKRSVKKEVAPTPAPAPEPAPKAKAKAKKVVESKPAPVPAPAPKAKAKKVKPEVKLPPPPPPVKKAPVQSASASTKVGGVALGAAPLLALPALALVAGRSVLTGTVARREKIQKEIDEFEQAKKKKEVQADVDVGGLATAAVRNMVSLFDDRTSFSVVSTSRTIPPFGLELVDSCSHFCRCLNFQFRSP
jgi:hypothetical protein